MKEGVGGPMDSPLLQRLNILHTLLFTEFFSNFIQTVLFIFQIAVHISHFSLLYNHFTVFFKLFKIGGFFWLKIELIQTNIMMGKGFLFPKLF